MRWLIFGAHGWIGGMFCKLLEHENIIIAQTRADDDTVEDEILKINPDRVICCIGRTHGSGCNSIDYLEQKDKLVENIRDNLFAPFLLASICEKLSIHLTYIGTGCIFNYTEQKNIFTEDDNPNYFGSSYSVVKGYTDRIMKRFHNVLNARIRMPISPQHNSRNFIDKIVNYDKICSIPNSMTVLSELLPILIDMATKKITGTYNFTNPGTIEHNEILQMYKQIIDPNKTWHNFTIEEQREILKSDRSNNQLDVSKLIALYPNIKNIKSSVYDILTNMSTSS